MHDVNMLQVQHPPPLGANPCLKALFPFLIQGGCGVLAMRVSDPHTSFSQRRIAMFFCITEFTHAFEVRASEVGLSEGEIEALIGGNISSAKLGFALVPPGQHLTNEQVETLLQGRANQGAVFAVKRLVFEAHTLLVADLNRVEKGDDATLINGPNRKRRAD